MRAFLSTALLLALAVPGDQVATAGESAPVCEVQALPASTEDVSTTYVAAIDASGKWIIGGSLMHDGSSHIVTWEDRIESQVKVPPEIINSYAIDITSTGDVVGSGVRDGASVSFVIVDGTYVELAAGKWTDIHLRAIDEHGHVVGYGNGAGLWHQVPLVWDIDKPQEPTRLRVPYGGSAGILISTDSRGTIVIGPNGADTDFRSWVIKPGGQPRPLLGVNSGDGYTVSSVFGRWAVGQMEIADQLYVPIRWDLRDRSPRDLGTIIRVGPVGDDGLVGGTTQDSRPLLTDGEITTMLPGLAPTSLGSVIGFASDGLVVGTSWSSDHVLTPVTWRC